MINCGSQIVQKLRLVSAWNGIKDVAGQHIHRNVSIASSMANLNLQHKHYPGVKTAWSQADLTLAVGGGESRYIRLWDASQELRRADVLTGSDSPITRLSFGPSHTGLLCAGFQDGSVRLYDVRCPDSRVVTFDGQDNTGKGAFTNDVTQFRKFFDYFLPSVCNCDLPHVSVHTGALSLFPCFTICLTPLFV